MTSKASQILDPARDDYLDPDDAGSSQADPGQRVDSDKPLPRSGSVARDSSKGKSSWRRGRLLRLVLGLLILVLALWTYYPGLFLPIGTQAVINARVLTIRAPIAGVVEELNAKEGERVRLGQSLGTLVNSRTDPSRLEQLRTEAAAMNERKTVLEQKIAVLEGLNARLGDELEAYRDVVINHIVRQIEENRAIRVARAALAAEGASNYRRQQALQQKSLTSVEKIEAAKRQAEVRRAELAQIEHTIKRLQNQLQAARKGIFLSDGFNNVPYSQQRRDEVTVLWASTRSDLEETKIRHRELIREVEIETERQQLLRSARLEAPFEGPVWRSLVNVGEYIEQGAPLLELVDPSEVFLLVHLDVRHFDSTLPGDRATIELLGSDTEIEGRVVNLRGGQEIRNKEALAVDVSAPDRREFRAVVAVNAEDLASSGNDFLQIGRMAKVRIHSREGSHGLAWLFHDSARDDTASESAVVAN